MKNFTVINETDSYILIEDTSNLSGGRTITNSAEEVVKDLIQNYNASKKIIMYRDSDGFTDQLLHDGQKFIDFNMLKQENRYA